MMKQSGFPLFFKIIYILPQQTVARVAQSVEHQAFNLRVQGSSPCSGEQFFDDPYKVSSDLLIFLKICLFNGKNIFSKRLKRLKGVIIIP